MIIPKRNVRSGQFSIVNKETRFPVVCNLLRVNPKSANAKFQKVPTNFLHIHTYRHYLSSSSWADRYITLWVSRPPTKSPFLKRYFSQSMIHMLHNFWSSFRPDLRIHFEATLQRISKDLFSNSTRTFWTDFLHGILEQFRAVAKIISENSTMAWHPVLVFFDIASCFNNFIHPQTNLNCHLNDLNAELSGMSVFSLQAHEC